MKILVIGDTGFVASYLLPAIRKEYPSCALYGISTEDSIQQGVGIMHMSGDISDESRIAEIVKQISPDIIINLSSISSVFESWSNPIKCHMVNYMGVLYLCLATIKHAPHARLVHISSLEVYGGSHDPNISYNEASALNPQSPYAVSKAASEMVIQQYGISHGLHYTILRPSNHTGPGRKPSYVLSGFARQIAEIKNGHKEPVLYVGNLNVHRDFLDVRDVVRAYIAVMMSEKTKQQIFNVSSGNSFSLDSLLRAMINLAGLNVAIKVDQSRFRPVDASYVRASNVKIKEVAGWRPEIKIETTLRELLEYWGNKTESES